MKDQQVEKASQIASLVVKYMQDNLSPQEQAELDTWLQEDSENYLLMEEMMDDNKLGKSLSELQSYDHDAAFQRLNERISNTTPVIRKKSFKARYEAAAALLVLTAGAYWLYSEKNTAPPAITQQTDLDSILPGGKKAILTLSDGTTIELNNQHQGIIAKDGDNIIEQSQPGRLNYSAVKRGHDTATAEHTLTVPRRGEYSIALGDGTVVWLNASSTLRFPVPFREEERRVKLIGEGYFQVANNPSRPFVVEVDSVEVRALGTEFNITAYPEDKKLGAALVQGLISISHKDKEHLLKPGNIAEINQHGKLRIKQADIEELTAWKNGEFIFHNTPFFHLMNQFARWYDIEVSYPEGIPPINFTGGLQRADGIYHVIHLLELTGEVRFTIEGRKVMVYPAK
jgi:transmembrane sensor